MIAEEFIELTRRRPFVPIRFHFADGWTFDFSQPYRVMVFRQRAEVAVDVDPKTGVVYRSESLWLEHIVRAEGIASSAN